MDGEESAIERTVFSVADNYQYSKNADDLLLKTKYYLGGVPFHLQWKLKKSSADVVSGSIFCLK